MIRILLQNAENDHILLQISDNGKGWPEGFQPDPMRSFGINLITTLTTQLEGDLELKGSNGVSVSILFRRKEA